MSAFSNHLQVVHSGRNHPSHSQRDDGYHVRLPEPTLTSTQWYLGPYASHLEDTTHSTPHTPQAKLECKPKNDGRSNGYFPVVFRVPIGLRDLKDLPYIKPVSEYRQLIKITPRFYWDPGHSNHFLSLKFNIIFPEQYLNSNTDVVVSRFHDKESDTCYITLADVKRLFVHLAPEYPNIVKKVTDKISRDTEKSNNIDRCSESLKWMVFDCAKLDPSPGRGYHTGVSRWEALEGFLTDFLRNFVINPGVEHPRLPYPNIDGA